MARGVPLIFFQSDRFVCVEHNPFGLQQGALEVLRRRVGAKADPPFSIDDPLPGNLRPSREAVEGVADLPGMAGHSGQACDLTVGGYFTPGDAVHDFIYARIKCTFPHESLASAGPPTPRPAAG